MKRSNLFSALCLLSALTPVSAVGALVLVDDTYTPTSLVFSVPAPGMLANDSSTSGGLRATSINITGTQGGVSAFADGSFTFTPTPGLATNTSFSYSATDNSGVFATATVTFDMVSTLPKGVNDAYTPNATVFSVAAPAGFISNDTGGIGGLRATSINITGTQGGVSAFADGSFTFTPTPGLATNTSFSYNMTDLLGRTSSATVTFDMVSTLPTAVNDFYTPNATVFHVAAPAGFISNDTGGIGGLRATSINITGTQGGVSAFADGSFDFTPTPGLATNTSFSYNMTDGLGRMSSATVNLDLVSTLPDAVDDLYSMFAGDTLNIAPLGMLANDLGGIGSLHAVSINITGLAGSVAAFANGSFQFTPTAGFIGTTSFDYTMADALGRFSTGTVELVVNPLEPSSVPEPATFALLGVGFAGLAAFRRRRQ